MCLFQWWIKIFWGGGWGLVVFEMPRFSLRASLFKAKCWFLAGSCKSREMKPTNPQHMKHNVCIVIFTHRGSEGMSITVFFFFCRRHFSVEEKLWSVCSTYCHPTCYIYSHSDGTGRVWGLLLPLTLVIHLILIDLTPVRPAVLLMCSLNPEGEAALTGSAEAEAPLEANQVFVLCIPQKPSVIQLHYHGQVTVSRVEPSDFVEEGRSERTWDDVTLEFYFLSLCHGQLLLFYTDFKIISWREKTRQKAEKGFTDYIFLGDVTINDCVNFLINQIKNV